MYFDEFDLEDEILDGLEAMNIYEATPVQEATIPLLLDGRDMIACAQTGTGKTAAYLLPIINRLSRGEGVNERVNAIVMAPTRELALQIDRQVEAFSYFLPISSVAIYGGTDGIAFAQQQRGLDMGADIIIATPGRLLALMNLGGVDFSSVSYFVLDEADRMLDMGFADDVKQIHDQMPEGVQTVMFSATMPPKIKSFAKGILRDPAEVEIAISRPPESIRQSIYSVATGDKVRLLERLFAEEKPERTIIFSSSKLRVKELSRALSGKGFRVAEMHSDLAQTDREVVMRDFKAGHTDVVVATDILARGIDIDDIQLVVNFDVPRDAEDYVHRIGRTARGNGLSGRGLTLVDDKERRDWLAIERFLGYKAEVLPLPEGIRPPREGAGSGDKPSNRSRGRGGKGGDRGRSSGKPSESKATDSPKGQDPKGAGKGQGRKPRGKGRRKGGRGGRPQGDSQPQVSASATE